ncbi:MAG: hypothetical protein QXV28_08985 [Ignisphaera sp.]
MENEISSNTLDRYRNRVISDRMISSLWITFKTILTNKGLTYLDNLLANLHIKKSQLYEHLRLLKLVDFVEVKKIGRRTAVLPREYARDKYEFKEKFLKAYEKMKEFDIYTIAFTVKEKMIEYKIIGDLFGAAKIHEIVPEHNRITHDINFVVLRDHSKYMDLLMKSMDFVLLTDNSVFPYSDAIYMIPGVSWKIFVLYDGVKHPDKPMVRFLDLSNVLRNYGYIPLEYVVAAKLLRYPHLRRKEDSEDIIYALTSDANVDVDKVMDIALDVTRRFPEFKPVLINNIDIVEWYLYRYELNLHVTEKMREILADMRRAIKGKEETEKETESRKMVYA